MEGSTSGLDVASLAQEVEVLELVAVEVSTDVDSFTTDNDNLLSAQQ